MYFKLDLYTGCVSTRYSEEKWRFGSDPSSHNTIKLTESSILDRCQYLLGYHNSLTPFNTGLDIPYRKTTEQMVYIKDELIFQAYSNVFEGTSMLVGLGDNAISFSDTRTNHGWDSRNCEELDPHQNNVIIFPTDNYGNMNEPYEVKPYSYLVPESLRVQLYEFIEPVIYHILSTEMLSVVVTMMRYNTISILRDLIENKIYRDRDELDKIITKNELYKPFLTYDIEKVLYIFKNETIYDKFNLLYPDQMDVLKMYYTTVSDYICLYNSLPPRRTRI